VIIPTNLKEGEIQIAFPRDGWGYIAIERGGILIGLHDVFLRQLIAFLSRYQAEGSAWPPYAEFDLINPSNGQEGPSTTLEVRVTKSGTQRLGDLSEMFD
jgi:hypothetical protein